jgi:CheY-like chemotaxis protein
MDPSEPEPRNDTVTPQSASIAAVPVDTTLVLVGASSPVNRIVTSRIIQRCGLKTMEADLESLEEAARGNSPCIVVIDQDADHDCTRLLEGLARLRNASAQRLPLLVKLSLTMTAQQTSSGQDDEIDAAVAKPVTPEILQPVIDRLIVQARLAAAS